MMRTLLFLLIVAASPAVASQPFSESLVECSALLDTLNRKSPWRRQTEKGAALEAAAWRLYSEARAAATEEGRSDLDEYISGLYAEKANNWDAKPTLYFVSQDAQDWFTYCGRLAESRGIDLG